MILPNDLFDHAPIGMLLMETDGTIIDFNAEMSRMVGWKADEIRGRHVSLMMDPAELEAKPIRYRIPTQAKTLEYPRSLRRKDGTTFPAEIRSSILSDGRLCSFVRDVSDKSRTELSLRESELRFRLVFDNSIDAIGVSLDGIHLFVNPAYLRLFGYENAVDLLGRPIVDLIAPESRELVLDNVRRRSRGEPAPSNYVIRGLRANGTAFDMEIHAKGYEFGGRIHTLVVARDVTKQKSAEEALRASEERYRRALEMLPVGVFQHEEGRLVWANEAGVRIAGANTTVELVGQPILRFVHPDSRQAVLGRLERMFRGERVGLLAEKFIRFDGSVVDVEVVAGPVDPAHPRRVLVVAVDVTERRREQQALVESESRYRHLVENIDEILYFVDLREGTGPGRVTFVGGNVESVIGRSPEEFLGNPFLWFESIHPDDREPTRRATIDGFRSGERASRSFRIRHGRTGEWRWFDDRVRFFRDENGRITSLQGVARDVTERRRAEVALRESRQELAAWHDLVTHDLANFSMTLLGLVERILDGADGPLAEAQRETLRRVFRQGFEMQRLAENAKLLSRLRAGVLAGPVADADLAATIAEAAETVRAVHFDSSVAIEVDCAPGLRVRGVPFLVNVVLNLLDNAFRYGGKRPGGRIEVRAQRWEEDRSRIELVVRGGTPPPDEHIPTLFDRYVKGPHSSGTGLGLAAVRELVVHAGGSVRARAIRDLDEPLFEVTLELPAA